MKDEFITGVNYWPIEPAMTWWHRFDAGVVKEDFSQGFTRDSKRETVRKRMNGWRD